MKNKYKKILTLKLNDINKTCTYIQNSTREDCIPFVWVATKCDIDPNHIDTEKISDLANDLSKKYYTKITHFETSSKENVNVTEVSNNIWFPCFNY